MSSLGKRAICDELIVKTLGSSSIPVETIFRASEDRYANDLKFKETTTGETRLIIRTDGHLAVSQDVEFYDGTNIASSTKRYSIGLNSQGDSFVIRDEVAGIDRITIDSAGNISGLQTSHIFGLDALLASKQSSLTVNGQPVNTAVLDTFSIASDGDGNPANSLLTAKAIEDWFEVLETRLCLVSPAESGPALRVGTIASSGPSSLNIPSCNAVSKFFSTKQTELGWSASTLTTVVGTGPSTFSISSLMLNKPLEIMVQRTVQSTTLTPLLLLRGPRTPDGNPAMLFSTEANSFNNTNTHFDYANITPTTDGACGLQIGTYPFITTQDQKRWKNVFIRATGDVSFYANSYKFFDEIGGFSEVVMHFGTSTVSSTEIGRLGGVTSSIQSQIDSKQDAGTYLTPSDLNDTTLSGTVNLPAASAVLLNSTSLETYVDSRVSSHTYSQFDIGSARLKGSTASQSAALVVVDTTDSCKPVVCSELVIAPDVHSSGSTLSNILATKLNLPSPTFVWPADLTQTELSYLDGVTSSVQTQIDGKHPLTGVDTVNPVAASDNLITSGAVHAGNVSLTNLLTFLIDLKHPATTVDSTPTENNTFNLVNSHGVYEAIDNLSNVYHPKTDVNSTVVPNSANLVTSGAVSLKISQLVDVYHPKTTVDAVPTENNTSNLVSSHGVYNALESKHPLTNVDSSVTTGSANLVTSGAVQTAIQTSKLTLEALITALTARVTALEAGGGGSDTGSLTQQKYDGYYSDSVSFFDTATPNGSSTTVTSISIGDEGSSYSYKWSGTWTPHVSGTWEFKTQSDDAAHVYIMSSGQSPGDSGTLIVDNGGTHGANIRTGSYVVATAGTVYTIHIYHGEATGGAQMDFWYKIPSGSYSQDLTKLGFFQP